MYARAGPTQGTETTRAMARQIERHGRVLSCGPCIRRRSRVSCERIGRSAARYRGHEPRARDHRPESGGVAPRTYRAGTKEEVRFRERRRGGVVANAEALSRERQVIARTSYEGG